LLDLCKKHHRILHLIIPSIIWKYVNKKDRLKVIKEVENFTLNKYSIKDDKEINEFLNSVGCSCGYELDEEDVLENWCPYCNKSIRDGDKNEHN